MITGLMVASLAVEPFLYAALFIEMAVLLAIPLLTSIYSPPGRGIVRFLIYQTLAMPFILVTGWLLAGVEASPGDLALAAQSTSMLGLGFAFLLAVFPALQLGTHVVGRNLSIYRRLSLMDPPNHHNHIRCWLS
jgi:hypothetical protein